MTEVYRLENVSLNLDNNCNMIILVDGDEGVGTDVGHDYYEGYKHFAYVCNKQRNIQEWDVERFWGWAELGGGVGTPKDNGYDCKQAHCVYCD